MSKNEDPDKYSYSGSSIGFNTCETFSLRDVGKNVIIFRVDNRSFVRAGKRKKDTLILDKSATDGLSDTTLTEEAEYSINLVNNKKLLLKFAL